MVIMHHIKAKDISQVEQHILLVTSGELLRIYASTGAGRFFLPYYD